MRGKRASPASDVALSETALAAQKPRACGSPIAGLAQWRARSPICIGNGGATSLRPPAPERQPCCVGALLHAYTGHAGVLAASHQTQASVEATLVIALPTEMA
jgi:hypothetical protein